MIGREPQNYQPKFGYIILVTDASNKQAGTWTTPLLVPAEIKITTIGQYTVAEHPAPLDAHVDYHNINVNWTAPPAGTGPVNLYAAVLSCNGNGTAESTDKWMKVSATYNEGWPTSVDDMEQQLPVSIYPNPATSILNIEAGNTLSPYSYAVYNMSGAITTQGNFSGKTSVDVSSLATGVHFVKITDGTNQKTILFNKL